jgi:plasmid stabilization system protein ParE
MLKLEYIQSFYDDLDAILDYITNTLENPAAATRLQIALDKAISKIPVFPTAHRLYQPSTPLPLTYRVIPVKNYLVFYTVLENSIERGCSKTSVFEQQP